MSDTPPERLPDDLPADLRVPRHRHLPPARRSAIGTLLTAHVAAKVRRRRLTTRIAVAGAGAVVVAAGAGAGYAHFHPTPVQQPHVVRCFTATTLDTGMAVSLAMADAEHGTATPGAAGAVRIDDPVSACANLWQAGVLHRGERPRHQTELHPGKVPAELTACTLRSGVAGVFPAGPNVCDQLGVSSFAPAR